MSGSILRGNVTFSNIIEIVVTAHDSYQTVLTTTQYQEHLGKIASNVEQQKVYPRFLTVYAVGSAEFNTDPSL